MKIYNDALKPPMNTNKHESDKECANNIRANVCQFVVNYIQKTGVGLRHERNLAMTLIMLLCMIYPAHSQDKTAVQSYESGSDVSELRRMDADISAAIGNPEEMKRVESDLIQLLSSESTFEAKRFACSRLAVCGTEASVDALAVLLTQESTAGIACLALGSIPSEKAGAALRAALVNGAKGASQLQIIATLGNRAEPASTAVMIKLAHDEDTGVAVAAIGALGAIGDRSARDALTAMRGHRNAVIENAAARATLCAAQQLLKAGSRQEAAKICEGLLADTTAANVRRGAFALLLQSQSDGGADRIAALLAGKPVDPILAPVAINQIPELRGWFVSRRFSKLLDTLESDQQALLIHALACRNEPSTRKAIRKQLNAADDRVRLAAVEAIGRTGNEAAVPILVDALSRMPSDANAQALENALAVMQGGERTDRALFSALNATGDLIIKKALLGALARRGGEVAVRSLVDAACETDEPLSKAAVQALTLLAGTGSTASLNALQAVLEHGEPHHRKIALKTLSAWRGTDAWETLAQIHRSSCREEETALALRGLIRILDGCNAAPDQLLFTRYAELLDHARSDADRKLVLNVLAGVKHPSALNLVYPMLEAPALRDAALSSVKRIADAIQKSHPDIAKAALDKIN